MRIVWAAHRDYFCARWKRGCSRSQRRLMLDDMITLDHLSTPQSVYPILRGWVFRKYLNPRTRWWGYCDSDIFVGDFSRTFPYDLALDDTFDVLMPTEPSDNGGGRLIFMRGHMTFFRNSETTEDRLLSFPHFKSFDTWDNMPLPGPSMGEAEYSHFVVGNPEINILSFDAMAPAPFVRSFSPAGILTHPDSLRPKNNNPPTLPLSTIRHLSSALPLNEPPPLSSFTDKAKSFSITVNQGYTPPDYKVWFNSSFCSWYFANAIPAEDNHAPAVVGKQKWKRYLTKIGGVWREILEPENEWDGSVGGVDGGERIRGSYTWLYAHWQEDKKTSHWRALPSHPPLPNILVSYFYDGLAAFDGDTGERIFWLPKKEESCAVDGCVNIGSPLPGSRPEMLAWRDARSDFVQWYVHSKQVRLGIETGTVGPQPSE
ncbi:hypothetical protein L198_07891 [Cryptococcus wingfieldii CBS 7118]|uniref:Uncharacterized protein n=1 Tax=Cryptococcus wingfieldii CBS 7118 TaxID=1295528 RepID=A0A1E3HWY6_9TREE|nr:hypothetical protein L198_07891 [Cryptococcus wingfieldii CBS 7118]ODN80081.1 hypothetical protein L198_07891 [Cryptococcus wingfieldii CBS 7118]